MQSQRLVTPCATCVYFIPPPPPTFPPSQAQAPGEVTSRRGSRGQQLERCRADAAARRDGTCLSNNSDARGPVQSADQVKHGSATQNRRGAQGSSCRAGWHLLRRRCNFLTLPEATAVRPPFCHAQRRSARRLLLPGYSLCHVSEGSRVTPGVQLWVALLRQQLHIGKPTISLTPAHGRTSTRTLQSLCAPELGQQRGASRAVLSSTWLLLRRNSANVTDRHSRRDILN